MNTTKHMTPCHWRAILPNLTHFQNRKLKRLSSDCATLFQFNRSHVVIYIHNCNAHIPSGASYGTFGMVLSMYTVLCKITGNVIWRISLFVVAKFQGNIARYFRGTNEKLLFRKFAKKITKLQSS